MGKRSRRFALPPHRSK